MNNYKVQEHHKCCGNCRFSIAVDHYGFYCTKGIDNPELIDWESTGEGFSDNVEAFHNWSDGREINWDNGICDDWESCGINI
jgi:hypothetical protein